MLKPFVPTEEKLADLGDMLIKNELYLSDEHRNPETVAAILLNHFGGLSEGVFYEVGDWQGLVGLANIVPGWKADLFFKVWDKSGWGATEGREIVEAVIGKFREMGLSRLSLHTPDEHTAKFARKHGFKEEGRFLNDFKWGGQSYDTICLVLN